MLMLSLLGQVQLALSFMATVGPSSSLGILTTSCWNGLSASSPNVNDEGSAPESSNKNKMELHSALESRVNEIKVEKTRAKLEDAHTKSFLKRRPIKLPYEDARIWVQANLGCDTKEEFYDLVANGNIRSPYIPKKPEQYYTETREWISWSHFLHGCFDNRTPSARHATRSRKNVTKRFSKVQNEWETVELLPSFCLSNLLWAVTMEAEGEDKYIEEGKNW
eukprot:scaffold4510_cov183-Amphora_coffeaeformis.AAC.64